MPEELVQWSIASQIHQGEDQSGDQHFIKRLNGKLLIGAIDGIGYGKNAAEASRAAVSILDANANLPLDELFELCHEGLANTRGVVMTLALIDSEEETLTWAGVGNVEGRLLRADKESSHPEETLMLRPGVVGHNLPTSLAISSLQIFKYDVLILATDGIHPDFASQLHIGRSANQIANDILERHSRGTDDALVVVARFRGGQSPSTS
jgi:hypothetical protein